MIERGFLRLLVGPSKTFYFLDGARERGVHAEYRLALEEFLNKKLKKQKKSIDVVAIPVCRNQVIPYLEHGYGGIGLGNWTVIPEREARIDFTSHRVKNVRELVVVAPEKPDLKSVEDLAGREVYVRRSSSYFQSLMALNERFSREGRLPIQVRTAGENLEDDRLLEMVNASLLPATVMDRHKWDSLFMPA